MFQTLSQSYRHAGRMTWRGQKLTSKLACSLEYPKCWETWHIIPAGTTEANDITPPMAWGREVSEMDSDDKFLETKKTKKKQKPGKHRKCSFFFFFLFFFSFFFLGVGGWGGGGGCFVQMLRCFCFCFFHWTLFSALEQTHCMCFTCF